MVKILEVDSSSGYGGGQKVMFDIVTSLMQEFDFLIASPKGVYSERYAGLGLRFFELLGRLPVAALRDIIKKESPDVLHAQGTRAALWARLSIIGLRKKPRLVYTLHGLHITRRPIVPRMLLLALERFLNRWTDTLVCVSYSDREQVLSYNLIDGRRIEVIRNGINLRDYAVDPKEAQAKRKEMGLEDKFVLISVGRLHPQKDFSTLLKAVKLLADENKALRLLIVGDGPLRSALEEETRVLRLADYVIFLGFRKDIPLLISVSDVLVLSTNWEAFGLVCIEAGASKRPVIASDIAGVREAVSKDETGFLFKPGSASDLAEKIRMLSGSEDLRSRMGERGLSFVNENFSLGVMVYGYKKLFSRIGKQI